MANRQLAAARTAVTTLEALADRFVCDIETCDIADEIRAALAPWHAADATCLDCGRDTSGCDDCLGCRACEGGDCDGCGGGIFPDVTEPTPAVQPACTHGYNFTDSCSNCDAQSETAHQAELVTVRLPWLKHPARRCRQCGQKPGHRNHRTTKES